MIINMQKIKLQSFENSSILLKFHIFFVVLSLIPLGVLMFLYTELQDGGSITVSLDQLNIALIIVVVGIISGYIAMRMMLNNVIDVTRTSAEHLRRVMGPEKIQEFLKGDENEIAVLTRTFREITSRLEENVTNLEMTKKTLQSVLTRVGQGISNMRNIDTFLDLIVETMTEALAGKKGILLLMDKDKAALSVKTACGMSLKTLDKKAFAVETGLFSPVIKAKTAMIIPKLQYLSGDHTDANDAFDYPIICAPLLLRDEVLGVLAVFGRKLGSTFQEEEMVLLLNLATQTAVAIENANLSANADKTYFETLSALAMAVEAKDPYSRGHLDRVGQYCVSIAQYMGLEPKEVGYLRDAAKVHDIGKIGITDDVLSKPGPLSNQEWVVMKRHPEIGEGIIKPITSLQPLCDIIRHHHEKLDGTGYPDGLKAEAITLPVRILAVADIYDALTTDRPYRQAMPVQEAEKVLRSMGAQVDQKIVDALIAVVVQSA
ncbi:MAG: HD domain-containing protein [Candidatus Omnitrophica bacterium]|nr:HD domain-containing protein [Candidatus Omnitrophota bacterium]